MHHETKKQISVGCVSIHHPGDFVEPCLAAVETEVCLSGFNGALQDLCTVCFYPALQMYTLALLVAYTMQECCLLLHSTRWLKNKMDTCSLVR